MEPLPPTTFPRRVKRFQSLSMTPLDDQVDFETDPLNNPALSSNKINFSATNKTPQQQSLQQSINPVTNQFSFKNRKKLFQNDNSLFKNTLKAQFGSTNKQTNNPNKNPSFLSNYKHRKMVSSQIFDSSSINSKNYLINKKTNEGSGFSFKNGERGSFQSDQQGKNQQGKKPHIPSFLLNKKRTPRCSQTSDYNNEVPRQMYESTPLSICQRKEQRWKTFKNQMVINSAKSIESQNIEVFSPPNQKIAYSKATASTLCTNLPREQSRRTFKDFDEMQELKQMSNSLQDSDNSLGLHREFDNLFKKEENGIGGNIEDEIAQLFSDEDAESEEFNHDLHNELQQLF